MNPTPFHRMFLRSGLLACGLALCSAASAAELALPINADTYLDSYSPATNFGNATSVKVLISSNTSACRGLLQLPPDLASWDPARLARVQVCFYVFKDQTVGRNITLFPLTRPFTEGTGTADGATWNTADGSNAWTDAGGDYDTNFPAVCTRETNGWFRWDITALLAEPAARSNLLAHGAILQIDELPVPATGIPRAPFTSSEGAAAERPYVLATVAAPLSLPITADTHLDSRTGSTTKNYGAATTVKTVINSSDASVTRGLFLLPPELALYAPAEIVSARVRFYVWQDNTAERNVTLYPLTQSFTPGTGNGTALADGATWETRDGTSAWTAAGGDFDANFPVIGVKEDILDPDLHDRYFSWDIAPLLTNDIARSNLLAHGALLMIDEAPVPASGTPRAPFTSSDDLSYAAAYRPHVDVKVLVRTPAIPQIVVADGTATVSVANCTPLVTNRIERTQDLLQTNGWTFVTNLVATGAETNWMETLPADWTNAFYRVVVSP